MANQGRLPAVQTSHRVADTHPEAWRGTQGKDTCKVQDRSDPSLYRQRPFERRSLMGPPGRLHFISSTGVIIANQQATHEEHTMPSDRRVSKDAPTHAGSQQAALDHRSGFSHACGLLHENLSMADPGEHFGSAYALKPEARPGAEGGLVLG